MGQYILGIDVGGTKIQAGLVNMKNQIFANQKFLFKKKNKKTAINSIINSIKTLYTKEVKAIGVGITGWIHSKDGIVVQSPNLPKNWHQVPLKKILEHKFKRPVSVDNDANCIALAEAIVGRGKKYSAVMSIILGTGVGAALVIDKKLFRGGRDAIEFGHIIINNKSSLESLVSGPAMVAHYYKRTGKKWTSYEIVQAEKTGNKTARAVLKDMSQWLAIGLRNAIYSYSPNVIVLGGGLADVPQLVRPAIRTAKTIPHYPDLAKIPIVISNLHYSAGVIGAALLTKSKKV